MTHAVGDGTEALGSVTTSSPTRTRPWVTALAARSSLIPAERIRSMRWPHHDPDTDPDTDPDPGVGTGSGSGSG